MLPSSSPSLVGCRCVCAMQCGLPFVSRAVGDPIAAAHILSVVRHQRTHPPPRCSSTAPKQIVAEGLPEAMILIVQDLRSRSDEPRVRAARQLRAFIESQLRELQGEQSLAFTNMMNNLNKCVWLVLVTCVPLLLFICLFVYLFVCYPCLSLACI